MSAEKTLPFPLVQANWKKAMTLEGDQAFGHNFYKNLFADHPALKETIFKGVSIESQKVNLPKSITTVLGILDDLPRALGALAALGRRHVRYATPDAGYAVVGANLIKTLGQILGSDFTEESKAEWIALYGIIEKTMVDACYTEAAIPDWKFISKRRATEFKTLILAPAAGKLDKFADSVSLATKGNFSSVLGNTAVIDEAIEKQSTAPIRAAGLRLAKEGKAKKENFAGLADAIASNIAGKSSANPYEKMVIDWFVLHLQAGFEGEAFDLSNPLGKKEAADAGVSSCSSCGILTSVGFVALAAAAGAAAWYFLKKK